MKRITLAVLIICLALRAGPARAAGAGQEPFNFLFLDGGARAVAMGGAYTALATDSNALLYNPAGLAGAGRYEATFMHNEYFHTVSQEYMGLVTPFGLGANVNFVDYGRTEKTTIANPAGTGSQFGITDLAVSVGYGRALTPILAAGGAVKLIRESIESISAQGYAFDFGLLAALPDHGGLRTGLSIQNIGPTVRFQHARENLPLNIRAGVARDFRLMGLNQTLAFDATKERSEGLLLALGAETSIHESMRLRAGFSTRNDAGPGLTVGVGWRVGSFGVDYAVVPYGELGYTHRISATLRWGASGSATRAVALKADAHAPAVGQYLARARQHLGARKFPEALAEADAALLAVSMGDPALPDLVMVQGLAYYGMNKFELSRAAFVEVVRARIAAKDESSALADAYIWLGRTLIAERRPKAGLEAIKRGLALDPTPQAASWAQAMRATLESPPAVEPKSE
ncbi:MAG: PorV/PorQ family protein [Elusimicrobia bacterium]|nr:PorV/PorQ family protein [Elusimicrobiota bacterium]